MRFWSESEANSAPKFSRKETKLAPVGRVQVVVRRVVRSVNVSRKRGIRTQNQMGHDKIKE